MTGIRYFQAGGQHIQQMTESRITFLLEHLGPQTEEDIQALRANLISFFTDAIYNNTYLCWMAEADGKIVGIGGMAVRLNPGNFKNPGGRSGYIMNMYTTPAYRKMGICSTILSNLMQAAKKMGIYSFELHATRLGEPVYQQFGFKIHNEPTYRKYELV